MNQSPQQLKSPQLIFDTHTIKIAFDPDHLWTILRAIEYAMYQLETDIEPSEDPSNFEWTKDIANIYHQLNIINSLTKGVTP